MSTQWGIRGWKHLSLDHWTFNVSCCIYWRRTRVCPLCLQFWNVERHSTNNFTLLNYVWNTCLYIHEPMSNFSLYYCECDVKTLTGLPNSRYSCWIYALLTHCAILRLMLYSIKQAPAIWFYWEYVTHGGTGIRHPRTVIIFMVSWTDLICDKSRRVVSLNGSVSFRYCLAPTN